MKNVIRKMRIKQVFIITLIVTLCAVGLPSVYALFSSVSESAQNTFKGGVVNVSVVEKTEHEDFKDNTETYQKVEKAGDSQIKQVAIKNKAASAYVRVTLVATLVSDDDADVMYLDQADVTYRLKKGTAWKVDSKNNVYYYTEVLEANETSDRLLEEVILNQDIPSGYHLEVKVLSDAISANPISNLQKAWGIKFEDLSEI